MEEIKEAITENDVNLEGGEAIYAMPTLAMLPANNFKININEKMFTMHVPCKGTYLELDPSFFTEEDGSFVIYEDNVLNISTITKVLFGVKQYPSLADNQLFCPVNFVISDNDITINGKIVTMLGD